MLSLGPCPLPTTPLLLAFPWVFGFEGSFCCKVEGRKELAV